ncbi:MULTISPECIES: cation diffusion facilitator family transporter [unclassified Fusibacter]|uniref:cation diffusion facilitator family transporter n=1 Tax=unclassified Fusibacter TaxID=2624464 RepID=UPI0010112169|nr:MULTISPECIES: cation diffusion facilitator family transporter [unclassified Fusibacter]MCK8060027.1 cation diffusion facilitator family transporter [Fusibacter sp. A2]NPE22167.1 cation transporter [Fusibacter sp. A1]RXV60943.1 cation transporter [Fusibacter sp. A1]
MTEKERSAKAKKVTWTGFWVNAFLAVIKLAAGIIGRSGAMVADGVHSLSDFMTDIVVFVGFKFTEQPEDECHNYGHAKYETIATLIISFFLVVVGFEIFKSGISNIWLVFRGNILPQPGLIAVVAAPISIVLKESLFWYTKKAGEQIHSSAIIANAWHHRSDALSSVGTFIGVGGAYYLGKNWTILDPIASLLVSILIFKVAFEILRPAVEELTEKALSEEEVEEIHKIIEEHPGLVKEVHKIKTRRLGNRAAIEFHLLVSPDLNIAQAHAIATHIENHLMITFGEGALITTHIEPFENTESIR